MGGDRPTRFDRINERQNDFIHRLLSSRREVRPPDILLVPCGGTLLVNVVLRVAPAPALVAPDPRDGQGLPQSPGAFLGREVGPARFGHFPCPRPWVLPAIMHW